MLEYFTYKKVKKHREEKAAEKQKEKQEGTAITSSTPQIISDPADNNDDVVPEGVPVLDHEDEQFLERLTSTPPSHGDGDGDETPPPLPPRVKTPVMDIDSDASSIASKETPAPTTSTSKGKEKDTATATEAQSSGKKRFTFSLRRKPVPSSQTSSPPDLQPSHLTVPAPEAAHEKTDLARVLDDLDLSARNNRAISLSAESAAMARRFTQVLKDLANGVPTAYGDLVSLLEDRDGLLARNYEKLPRSLKKLVAQLPDKLTSSLAPELLAVAAEAQGLSGEEGKKGGLKDAAKSFLTPANLQELVTKPGAVAGLLKGVVNALKTRFPAFVGTNVLWSLAVFLLLSMLWYCHKRGREVRLEREAEEAARAEGRTDETIDGRPRVEELPDDPMLAAPLSDASRDGEGTRG